MGAAGLGGRGEAGGAQALAEPLLHPRPREPPVARVPAHGALQGVGGFSHYRRTGTSTLRMVFNHTFTYRRCQEHPQQLRSRTAKRVKFFCFGFKLSALHSRPLTALCPEMCGGEATFSFVQRSLKASEVFYLPHFFQNIFNLSFKQCFNFKSIYYKKVRLCLTFSALSVQL